MKYFNGFSLKNEENLFDPYLIQSNYTVAGFSYGAQQAFEYVYQSKERVDRLILLSPAFFQTQKQSFIRTQLRYFEAGQEAYVQQFLSNVAYPSRVDMYSYLNAGSKEDLDALLKYEWDPEKIQDVLERGTIIEVFIGMDDKIIDAQKTFEFFSALTVTYFIKHAGHLLKISP
ncbi:MAG TPA: pimelyl-ACP methyl ester esterase BioV [Sulfurovum sp.]